MNKNVKAPKGFHWMKSGKGVKLMKNPIVVDQRVK